MPPKTVKCSVCGQEVLKAQTLAKADGSRACRSHPGVEEEAQKLKDKEHERREQETKPVYNSHSKFMQHCAGVQANLFPRKMDDILADAAKFREDALTHCWTCGKEGISLRDYYAESLVAMKRLEMRGEFNLFTINQDIRKMLGNPTILVMLPYDDQKDGKIRHEITDRRIKNIIHFLRSVNMCTDCINRHGLGDRLEALMPKPTWEQLEAIMPVMAAIEPVIKELAEEKEKQS